jgi:hypothetical protein
LVVGILLTAGGFTSDILGEYLGPIEYKGYIVFDYPEGENPIINIVFTVDSTLAGNLIIVNVPSPWSHSYGGGILALSGGSIGPGGSVRVTVSLNRYFEDGEYAVSSVGTTSVGEVSLASGPLLVGELYLLNVLGMASSYRFPLVALVGGLGFLELFLSRRARAWKEPQQSKVLQSGRPYNELVTDASGVAQGELVTGWQEPQQSQARADDDEYDDNDLPRLDDPEVTEKTEPVPPYTDSSEYDDSDLPGLDDLDESDTDTPPDSSDKHESVIPELAESAHVPNKPTKSRA